MPSALVKLHLTWNECTNFQNPAQFKLTLFIQHLLRSSSSVGALQKSKSDLRTNNSGRKIPSAGPGLCGGSRRRLGSGGLTSHFLNWRFRSLSSGRRLLCPTLTSFDHLRLFSTLAENQQASLQLLCLRCVQRSAVDGQNPELHLWRLSCRPQTVADGVDRGGVVRVLRAEAQRMLHTALCQMSYIWRSQRTKCLVGEDESRPNTPLCLFRQQPVRAASVHVKLASLCYQLPPLGLWQGRKLSWFTRRLHYQGDSYPS